MQAACLCVLTVQPTREQDKDNYWNSHMCSCLYSRISYLLNITELFRVGLSIVRLLQSRNAPFCSFFLHIRSTALRAAAAISGLSFARLSPTPLRKPYLAIYIFTYVCGVRVPWRQRARIIKTLVIETVLEGVPVRSLPPVDKGWPTSSSSKHSMVVLKNTD
jgi:hypothetical protein